MTTDMLTDRERRMTVHILAALRECIRDELEYWNDQDLTENGMPDFRGTLDEEERFALVYGVIEETMTTAMYEVHHEVAAAIQADIDADWDARITKMAQTDPAWAAHMRARRKGHA